MKEIILASGSPRRHELLTLLGIKHTVIPCKEEEGKVNNTATKVPTSEKNAKKQTRLEKELLNVAYQKTICVAKQLTKEQKENTLLIGADTIVVLSGEVIGKPHNEEKALDMLQKLSGKTHQVYTGICIYNPETDRTVTAVERTDVSMLEWDKERLKAHIGAEYVLDKAGAYAIQGIGAAMINNIQGCYYNVMGLPLSRLVKMLQQAGYNYLEQVKTE